VYSIARPMLLGQLLVIIFVFGTACAAQPSPTVVFETGSPWEDLEMVAAKTYFFGHQSVGANILQGVEELDAPSAEQALPIVEFADSAAITAPALVHTTVGENYDPLSKIQAFDDLVRNQVGEHVDVAFFKFCYVDFDGTTDVDGLFETYQQTMDALVRDFPQTTFVYVTVPLMAKDQGIKAFVKSVIGRVDPANANLQRHRFNQLLREEYADTGRLFDLAQAEATYAGDQMCTMRVQGQAVPCLYPQYTDDGGHLNELGRRVIAEQFVAFLADLKEPARLS
jgi:hypothetical protein